MQHPTQNLMAGVSPTAGAGREGAAVVASPASLMLYPCSACRRSGAGVEEGSPARPSELVGSGGEAASWDPSPSLPPALHITLLRHPVTYMSASRVGDALRLRDNRTTYRRGALGKTNKKRKFLK